MIFRRLVFVSEVFEKPDSGSGRQVHSGGDSSGAQGEGPDTRARASAQATRAWQGSHGPSSRLRVVPGAMKRGKTRRVMFNPTRWFEAGEGSFRGLSPSQLTWFPGKENARLEEDSRGREASFGGEATMDTRGVGVHRRFSSSRYAHEFDRGSNSGKHTNEGVRVA